MNYSHSAELTEKARELCRKLGFRHIDLERIACIKSSGTKTRRVVARIHGMEKAIQIAMQSKPFYTIELISERFDKLSEEEKTKTLIHELMHIPHSFGGGFRHHNPHVTNKKVEEEFLRLTSPE